MKTEDALEIAAPNGIDCFYENVGGPASSAVISKMNLNGRIALCGAISVYNDEKPTMVPSFVQYMVFKVCIAQQFCFSSPRTKMIAESQFKSI